MGNGHWLVVFKNETVDIFENILIALFAASGILCGASDSDALCMGLCPRWKSSGTEDGNKGKSRAGQHRAPYGS
ncbi:hypothetical protein [Prevotella intermedia]|uniref:hypothetical protein n=1 Tax=Prevotella intermedia TaxID=28131 RepID=UPI0012FE1A7B|nr:hypothetical protein [Prevotella intermedia]